MITLNIMGNAKVTEKVGNFGYNSLRCNIFKEESLGIPGTGI